MSKATTIAALTRFAAKRAVSSKPTTLRRTEEATGAKEVIKLRTVCVIPTMEGVADAMRAGGGATYSSVMPVVGDPNERKAGTPFELNADAAIDLLYGRIGDEMSEVATDTAPAADTAPTPATVAQTAERVTRGRRS